MKIIARESSTIKKARQKTRKHLNAEEKKLTNKALKASHQSLLRWIEINAKNRENLKNKDIAVFDENQHSAKITSTYVLHLKNQLQQKLNAPQTPSPLSGRATIQE